MRVICINDKGQPEGAEVQAGAEYTIEESFVNNFGQKVFLIKGICNGGRTSNGLLWYGYDAARFAILSGEEVNVEKEILANPMLN